VHLTGRVLPILPFIDLLSRKLRSAALRDRLLPNAYASLTYYGLSASHLRLRVDRPAMLPRRPASQRLFFLLVSSVLAAHTTRCEPGARTGQGETTLVVYSYRHADPEALGNLQHFVSAVIKPQDPARYIIVVDQAMQQHGHMSAHGLPQLSANAEYLTIRDCFELGHVGKVLLGEKSSVHVSMAQYQYFVWLDSSAKGPLLPTHTLQGDHASAWHTLLTSRITATTKLVGANIVCEPIREVKLRWACTNSMPLHLLSCMHAELYCERHTPLHATAVKS